MGKRAIEAGDTAKTVASNIRRFRLARGMTMSQLSDNLSDAGRPMTGNMVSAIETMARRVDVDDLVVFATALNVSPAALLMPACEECGLDARETWAWLTAASPKSDGTVDISDHFAVEAWRREQVPEFAWRRGALT